MKKEVFDILKKEFAYIGILFLTALIIFKIAFYKEGLMVVLVDVLSLLWLFVLPGYFVMLHWKDKIDFTERIIIGTALAVGVIGSSSYYLGLFGLHIKYHILILPTVIILASFIILLKR
ncbi:MAG: hypothetical protein AABX33_05535 [Nanoarchaeota archaeon]